MARSWKTLVVVVTTAVIALALSTTSALAGSGGSGTGSPWRTTVAQSSARLYPGAGAERLAFTVANSGRSAQTLHSVTVSILTASSGDAETAASADIPGCRASWFTASVGGSGGPGLVAPGGSYTGAIELSMQDSGTDQDTCRGAAPAVTVTAG